MPDAPEPLPVPPSADRRTRAVTLAGVRERLQAAGIEAASAATEAELLMLHALGRSRADFWMSPRAVLSPEEAARVEALAARREQRIPLQHLIGSVDFHEVTLAVEPGVFVPRPETESLIEVVLERLRAEGRADRPGRLIDLGTGTGAIAVALLKALPAWTGVAADRSPAAVALAARNAEANGVADRLQVVQADCFGALGSGPAAGAAAPAADPAGRPAAAPAGPPAGLPPGPYDVVVSNPPYIPSGSIQTLMPEVRDHDPREALDGGPDGLGAYRALARVLPFLAGDKSLIALEMGDDQADRILGLSEWEGMIGGRLETPQIRQDLAGRQRIVVATWRGGVA